MPFTAAKLIGRTEALVLAAFLENTYFGYRLVFFVAMLAFTSTLMFIRLEDLEFALFTAFCTRGARFVSHGIGVAKRFWSKFRLGFAEKSGMARAAAVSTLLIEP